MFLPSWCKCSLAAGSLLGCDGWRLEILPLNVVHILRPAAFAIYVLFLFCHWLWLVDKDAEQGVYRVHAVSSVLLCF